jgi:hypothetical protein
MIENIIVKKGNKNFYNINVKDGEEYKNLVVFLKDCFVPFGIEEYNKKYILNFEVDKTSEFYSLMRKLESKILELLPEDDEFELKSVFHKKPKFNLLCKAHLKSNKNLMITKYLIDKNEISVFELIKAKKYNLELEISGMWTFKDNVGFYLNINKISTNNI